MVSWYQLFLFAVNRGMHHSAQAQESLETLTSLTAWLKQTRKEESSISGCAWGPGRKHVYHGVGAFPQNTPSSCRRVLRYKTCITP